MSEPTPVSAARLEIERARLQWEDCPAEDRGTASAWSRERVSELLKGAEIVLTALEHAERALAQYQRESADENDCTKHPGAILAYGCSHCHADERTRLGEAEQRGLAQHDALTMVLQTWAEAWDCSRDPGHVRMQYACIEAEKALTPGALSAPPPGVDKTAATMLGQPISIDDVKRISKDGP